MKLRPLFSKYQKYLCAFANTWYGRGYLELDKWAKIKNNYKIIKVAPDGIHWWTGEYTKKGKPICQAVFFPKSQYLKKFDLALNGLEIASSVIGKIHKPELVIPHFSGLNYVSWLPLIAYDTLTVNPDADAETTSVDGDVTRTEAVQDWVGIRTGAGTQARDSISAFGVYISSNSDTNKFDVLQRGICLFDTSGLGASTNKQSAVLSLYGQSKSKTFTNNNFKYRICLSNPVSNTALANEDYEGTQATGGTGQSDTEITYDDWSTVGYNDFTLNSTGLGNVSLIDISKFSGREAVYDAAQASLTWEQAKSLEIYCYSSDNGSNKPKLVVTYTSGAAGGSFLYNFI